jgi:hypothetical protein
MKTEFMATAIGSMPFEDPAYSVDVSLGNLRQAPIWPQLPRLGLNEQMEVQYSEGMPNAVIDYEKRRMFFDTAKDYSEAFAEFYERYLAATDPESGTGDFSSMAISPDFSKGVYAFESVLKARSGTLPFIKVQTTGPCSFALTIVDENKRAIYYNEEFRDVIVKALAMKCRWQLRKFQPYAEKLICFVDEPILSAFGSSTYVTVKREDVVALLGEMVQAIRAEGALAGIHCCGNTEWSILTDAGADIVNFDAFEYGMTVSMYPEAIKAHLERGGILAWGIVPTSKAVRDQSVASLEARLEETMDRLASTGIDKQLIADQAMITPSCGTGSMEKDDAEKVFTLTRDLSERMKGKYGRA